MVHIMDIALAALLAAWALVGLGYIALWIYQLRTRYLEHKYMEMRARNVVATAEIICRSAAQRSGW